MRRQTKEMIKRIAESCNMTPAQRNKALIDEAIENFKARGGRVTRLQATEDNFHAFVSVSDTAIQAIEFLQA